MKTDRWHGGHYQGERLIADISAALIELIASCFGAIETSTGPFGSARRGHGTSRRPRALNRWRETRDGLADIAAVSLFDRDARRRFDVLCEERDGVLDPNPWHARLEPRRRVSSSRVELQA